MSEAGERAASFGQGHSLSPLDKLGIWLSSRRIRGAIPRFTELLVADIGCGYNALFVRGILNEIRRAVLVDIALAEDLKGHPKIVAMEGVLPGILHCIRSDSQDVVLCNNVIEHLWEPLKTLKEVRRIAAIGGTVFVNVPSWRGKRALEFSAFRLGLSPEAEMNDHKMYYDVKDLWPVLVQAGFLPQGIRIGRHKFGLNTYAVCKA